MMRIIVAVVTIVVTTAQATAASHYRIPFSGNSHSPPPDCWVIRYPELS